MLKRDLSGVWTTPNQTILEPLIGSLKSCAEKIQKQKILESTKSNGQDFRNLNLEVVIARAASFKTVEPDKLNRQALVALLVELSLTVRNLYPTNPVLVELNQTIGEAPSMQEAARLGYKEIVEILLKSGAKVDAADNYGWQPLHEAAKYGHKDIAGLLLAQGAKVDPIDKYGWQPLHWAAKHGHKETVALLLVKGAKIDAVAKDGKQPLHLAAWNGNKEVVELLLLNGAKADAADKNGKLPSNEAEENCHKEVAELLQTALFNEPLLSLYRKQGYLTRFLDKRPFPIEQSYINLALVEQESDPSSRDASNPQGKPIQLDILFSENSQIYMEGNAGSGKTTLCRYLVSTWATLSSEKRIEIWGPSAKEYETLIFLPLREIRSLSESATLKEFVLERYPELSFDKIHPNKTLYILDGFDEIASLEESCRISKIDKRWKIVETLIKQPKWIITSRPNLFSERFFGCRRIHNIGFTDDNIQAYIVRFCEDYKIESRKLKNAIFYRGDIRDLARIPLYLELVCSLWKENPLILSSLNNFASLYDEMAVLLFRRLLMRLEVNTKGLFPKEILSHESVKKYRECLEAVAFDAKRSGGNRIGPEIYRPHFEQIPVYEREAFGKWLFDELGLLTPIDHPKELFDQVYSFIHPTFEEYFAAKCLISRLDSAVPTVSLSAADWLLLNCLSKSFERMTDFTAALACSEKQLDALAKALLSAEQPKNSSLNAWQLPLHRAAEKGLSKLSECLLKYGAKVDAADKNVNYCNQPLHLAAQNNHTKVIELLLQKGAKVDAANNRGMEALHIAAQYGHKEVIELLLMRGAKVNGSNSYSGHLPIHFAAERGHIEVVDLLLKHGAKADAADKFMGQQPIHFAARSDHKEVIDLLLKRGAKVDAVDSEGWQPLHEAAGSGSIEATELLLKQGAKVDAANKKGQQPLCLAARYGRRYRYYNSDAGHKEVAEILLQYGAKVDAADDNGVHPLHFAASMGNQKLVELLLKHGAKVDAADHNGRPPLHWAARNGNEEIVELLQKHGAKANAADKYGWQTLHVAAEYRQKKIVELLLKYGAKVNATNKEGKLPMQLAALKGYNDIVELLGSK